MEKIIPDEDVVELVRLVYRTQEGELIQEDFIPKRTYWRIECEDEYFYWYSN